MNKSFKNKFWNKSVLCISWFFIDVHDTWCCITITHKKCHFARFKMTNFWCLSTLQMYYCFISYWEKLYHLHIFVFTCSQKITSWHKRKKIFSKMKSEIMNDHIIRYSFSNLESKDCGFQNEHHEISASLFYSETSL